MSHIRFTLCFALTFSLSAPSSARADEVILDDLIITGNFCVGTTECMAGEDFGQDDIKIKSFQPQMLFEDNTPSDTSWRIGVGANSNDFIVENATARDTIMRLSKDARLNALTMSAEGRLGLGTLLPEKPLHIVTAGKPTIMLERSIAPFQKWTLTADDGAMGFRNFTSSTTPFLVQTGAPDGALHVIDGGNVGIGTDAPGAPLELSSTDSFNFFRISATGAAVNDSVDITFTGGPLGTGQLRYNIVDGDAQEMSLDADGNMVLDGTLTTAGPTCAAGCDRVFDADYALPSIADHAAEMFAAGHLPSVGATLPGQPVNVTEKMANMLNALEHAHVYIALLSERDAKHLSEIAELKARLVALETRVTGGHDRVFDADYVLPGIAQHTLQMSPQSPFEAR